MPLPSISDIFISTLNIFYALQICIFYSKPRSMMRFIHMHDVFGMFSGATFSMYLYVPNTDTIIPARSEDDSVSIHTTKDYLPMLILGAPLVLPHRRRVLLHLRNCCSSSRRPPLLLVINVSDNADVENTEDRCTLGNMCTCSRSV